MPLNIYDVIFWEGDGEPDTIYVITAHTHHEAVEMAERDRGSVLSRGEPGRSGRADSVSLIGESRLPYPEPQILRGPFREMGVSRGETWLYDEQTRKWLSHDEYYKPKTES